MEKEGYAAAGGRRDRAGGRGRVEDDVLKPQSVRLCQEPELFGMWDRR